jgi:DNA-binding transcriptional regulator PaaX
MRLREVAASVGITERAVQAIVADLEAAGVLTRTREGRRNRYTIHPHQPLRHPVEAGSTVADLLELVG